MNKQPNQADQKQQRDPRENAQQSKSPPQGTNKDQAPGKDKSNPQNPNDSSPAGRSDPSKGFDRDETQRMQRDNTTTDTDEESPRMNEGDDAPSVRRGALNTQYDSDKSPAGKPGAAVGGPDDRSIDKERTTGDRQDTLVSPRGVNQP